MSHTDRTSTVHADLDTPSGAPRPGVAGHLHGLSPAAVCVAAGAIAAGILTGAVQYADRSSTVDRHTAGTEAWPQHAIIAVVAAALLVGTYVLHRRRGRAGEAVLLAPFGRRAAVRLRATWQRPGRRAAVSVPLLVVCVYSAWRAGEQITGGLDPSFTANAWGGPSYLGAMICHYLDGALIFAAAAYLLSRVLVPAARTGRTIGR